MNLRGCCWLLLVPATLLADDGVRGDGAAAMQPGGPPIVTRVGADAEARPVLRETREAAARRVTAPGAVMGTARRPESPVGAWPLLVVLGAIALAAFIARRWLPQTRLGASGGGPIRILARQPVSPKQSLCLVRVGRSVLLVGVSPERIETLTTITDPDAAAELVGAAESQRTGSLSGRFQEMLTGAAGRFDEPPSDGRTWQASQSGAATAREAFSGLTQRLRALGTTR